MQVSRHHLPLPAIRRLRASQNDVDGRKGPLESRNNVLAGAIRTHTPELIIVRQQSQTIEENSLDLGIGW
jgi:hypothetical protein